MRIKECWSASSKNPDLKVNSPNTGVLKLLVVTALFALSVAPTFISYQPYFFQWDDSDYFARSIGVSLAFWTGNSRELERWMVSHHPPAMTLLGLPWGPLHTWDAAGDSFITLACVISVMAVLSLFFLLRIGVKPLFLVIASVCVGVSLGPYPAEAPAHLAATAFMADSLFAWTALVAVLLIPYEARFHSSTVKSNILRGLLWGLICSVGTMTKLSFLYFVVMIVPILFLIRLGIDGRPRALTSLVAFGCSSIPCALYLLRWGRYSIYLARTSSFGGVAGFYYAPLPQFVVNTVRESPGLAVSLVLTASALIYLLITRQSPESWSSALAVLIMFGYALVALVSPNREIRFSFPVMVALPFLAAISLSRKESSVPSRLAILSAVLAFGGLLAASVPTRHRPQWQSFSRCNAVLAQAARLNAGSIILATDSPTLNAQLMMVADLYSSRPANVYSLAYTAMSRVPIEEDFRAMSSADLVVFQDRAALSPPFTNQRVSEYERYAQQSGFGPIRIAEDTNAYVMRFR